MKHNFWYSLSLVCWYAAVAQGAHSYNESGYDWLDSMAITHQEKETEQLRAKEAQRKDEAAIKIQKNVRGRLARQQVKELEAKEAQRQQDAATKIQAVARGRAVRQQAEQLRVKEVRRKDEAATKIQKNVRGRLARNEADRLRKQAKFKAIIDKIPYDSFRELICTGKFLNETSWFYEFIEIQEGKELFERNKIEADGTKTIDPKNAVLKDSSAHDYDKLFEKYINPYIAQCLDLFEERAVDEITVNKMPWHEAVSIMGVDGTPQYPLGIDLGDRDDDFESYFDITLSNIFSKTYAELMPPLHLPAPVVKDFGGTMFADVKAFGQEFDASIEGFRHSFGFGSKPGETLEQVIDEQKEHISLTLLKWYFRSMGHPEALTDEQLAEYGIEPESEAPQYGDFTDHKAYEAALDKWMAENDTRSSFIYDHTFSNIDYHFVAHQVFQLGRLLFDGELDAFEALGGQTWLEKQPADIQEIIKHKVKQLKSIAQRKKRMQ